MHECGVSWKLTRASLDWLQTPLEKPISLINKGGNVHFLKQTTSRGKLKRNGSLQVYHDGLCTFLSESHQTLTKDKTYKLHRGGILQKAPEPVNIRCNGTNDYQVTEAHKTLSLCGILGKIHKKIIIWICHEKNVSFKQISVYMYLPCSLTLILYLNSLSYQYTEQISPNYFFFQNFELSGPLMPSYLKVHFLNPVVISWCCIQMYINHSISPSSLISQYLKLSHREFWILMPSHVDLSQKEQEFR